MLDGISLLLKNETVDIRNEIEDIKYRDYLDGLLFLKEYHQEMGRIEKEAYYNGINE